VKRQYSATVNASWPWLSCSGSQSAPWWSTAHGTLPSLFWYGAYQRAKSRTSRVQPIRKSAADIVAPSRIHERV
jgi:hypothetical protein